MPGLRRLAILGNTGNPAIALEMSDGQAAARRLGLDVAGLEIRRAEDIAPAFDALKGRVDALYVAGDPLTTNDRVRIIILALAARLPTIFASRDIVESGGLMSYGPNQPDQYRRAADNVEKFCAGQSPPTSRPAANQVRSRDQSNDCEGAGSDRPTDTARHRRRGDRIRASIAAPPSMSGIGD